MKSGVRALMMPITGSTRNTAKVPAFCRSDRAVKILISIPWSAAWKVGPVAPGNWCGYGLDEKLKAIVIKGSKPIPVADAEGMRKLGLEDLRKVGEIDKKTGWSIQGTTGVLAWCNEVAALPVHNMRQTHHPDAWKIDGERLNNARVATYGCPNCTMRCGITILDHEGHESELDYENIGMLGSNLDILSWTKWPL